jgi:uncharacterized protein YjiS (DUF1127 family)
MASYLHRESPGAFAERPAFSWRAFFNGTVERARAFRERRKQRHELLDYMASDHRAAADLGLTDYEARNWSERSFWRD